MSLLYELRNAPVTMFVMGICLVNYLRIVMSGSNIEMAVECGCFDRTRIRENREWWRLLTTGFVHVRFLHIAMNVYALYCMDYMELLLGSVPFAILIFGGIIAGSIAQYFLSRTPLAVGLSGGLYAVMSAQIVLYLLLGWITNSSVLYSVLQVVIINAVMNFLPNVGWQAHLGGAIWGIVFMLAFWFLL